MICLDVVACALANLASTSSELVINIEAPKNAAMSNSCDLTYELRRLALAWFDGAGPNTYPPEWLERALFAAAPDMPPDLSPETTEPAPYRWLRLASALDFVGDLDGARELLDRLEAAVSAHLAGTDAGELLALLCARRGRLARQRGEVDAAVDWYQRGLARANGARHRDAWGACVQGLATCAQFRGDSVTAERLSRLVAVNHAVVPRYARVAAMLTLAVIYRKKGRIAAALRCAWHAHDLVDERDERRGMALVELSHLALSRGEFVAAQRGCSVILSFARTIRVRRPARSVVLLAALQKWRSSDRSIAVRDELLQHAQLLVDEAKNAPEQWERLHASFDALDAYLAISEHQMAHRLISDLRGEVDLLRLRNESAGWAEHRLAEAQRNSCTHDSVTVATPAHFPAEARAVTEALARLAGLEPLSQHRTQVADAFTE